MKNDEILEKLRGLRFCIFWPPSEWEDIGFTERPIWINHKGYGYIGEDDYSEPCSSMQIDGIPEKDLHIIKEKMKDGSISIKDIESTSLIRLNDLYRDNDDDFMHLLLQNNLETLPSYPVEKLYCERTDDGWIFFDSEENLIAWNEDEFCTDAYFGETWESLNDLMLKIWYERIFREKHDMVLPLSAYKL